MFNEPPEKNQHPLEEKPKRKLHPLEEPPPVPQQPQQPRRTVKLKIPIAQPIVTYVLLAVNVAVYVLGFLMPELDLLSWGATSTRQVLEGGQYYRLLTAMFLHASPQHIFFNMAALYFIGTSLEPIFGNIRFAIIYLMGGLAGSILSVGMSAILGSNASSVGASGAVFAIFGAEMIYLYRHRTMLGERGQSQFRNLLFLLVANFMIGIISTTGGAQVRIDNWAHLGGLLGGLFLTWVAGPIFLVQQDPQKPDQFTADDLNPVEKKYWVVSAFLIGLVAVLTVLTFLVR